MTYVGRFAPSPTGPLHFGSLVAAVGSYLDARASGGAWLLRMEDLDPPREVPGAAEDMLKTLEILGFQWDSLLKQSSRLEAYAEAAERLVRDGAAFPCACSRREIADSSVRGIEGPVYPGTCRAGLPPGRNTQALRLKAPAETLCFQDRLQGRICQQLARDIGDFIIRRADGCFAYQLAVVVDDAYQGITHVVRGADLLLSTPRQILLQRLLGHPTPVYIHLPVAVDRNGEKLSKQTGAEALDLSRPAQTLWRALRFLRQEPPAGLEEAGLAELWAWAIEHWDMEILNGVREHAID
ncbi:MAG TPA: tRNA glutamyl-Q(34) synthetase GluQRS [Gammaproteobacteria bacterium]|nr:tRNA glutamyl-Q(34) synthetase GluQRS [Gammaproteobacteria bacterium]